MRETQLPLAPEERQLLLDELEGHQRQQAALGGGGPAGRPAADSAWGQEGAADEERPFAEEDSPAAGPPPPRPHVHQTKARTAGTAGVRRRLAAGDPEILPAEEEEGAGPAPGATLQSPLAAGVEWLGWCGQQAQQAAAAVLRPLVSGLGAEQPRRGAAGQQAPLADPAAALHLLGGGVLGAVLLYAVYAERQALGRGARRARQAVVGSVAELLRMAFSLGVNPMA